MRRALLLGATGLVGGHLLRLLLASPAYDQVRVLVRRPTGLQHPKLDERVVDWERLAEQPELFAADDLFCCLGTTIKQAGSQAAFRRVDFDYPLTAAKLAKAAGVQRYLLVSSLGADPRSRIFYSRVKGEVEEAIAAIGLPALAIFQPSLLLGERAVHRPGEAVAAIVSRILRPIMVGPLAATRAIEGEAVARGMLEVALRDEVAGVRRYRSDEIERISQR